MEKHKKSWFFHVFFFYLALSLQEQYQLNYVTSREQLRKPKPVNKLSDEDEDRIKEIWFKVVKRADRHILITLNAVFDKVKRVHFVN